MAVLPVPGPPVSRKTGAAASSDEPRADPVEDPLATGEMLGAIPQEIGEDGHHHLWEKGASLYPSLTITMRTTSSPHGSEVPKVSRLT